MLPLLPIDRPQYSSNLSIFFCVFYTSFNTHPLSFLQHLPCLINFFPYGRRTFPISSLTSPPGWHPGRSPEVLIGSAIEQFANFVQSLWNFTSLDLYSGFLREKSWSCYMFPKPFCDFIGHSQSFGHTKKLLFHCQTSVWCSKPISHVTTIWVWKNSTLPLADVPCEEWVTSSFGMTAQCQVYCESSCTQHHTLDINSLRWCEQGHSFGQTLKRKQVGWKDNSIRTSEKCIIAIIMLRT